MAYRSRAESDAGPDRELTEGRAPDGVATLAYLTPLNFRWAIVLSVPQCAPPSPVREKSRGAIWPSRTKLNSSSRWWRCSGEASARGGYCPSPRRPPASRNVYDCVRPSF